MRTFNCMSKKGLVSHTTKVRAKAVVSSKLIIIAAVVPILSLQKVEGESLSPLAHTVGFA